jgi:hypothetical protein
MKYRDLKEKQRKEFSTFPIFFAFSEEQFKEGKNKLNVVDNNELISIAGGGFIRKEDKENFNNLFSKITDELKEYLKNNGNLLDAMEYELANHEYCVNYDHETTLDVLGLSFDTMTDEQKEIFKTAKKNYLSHCNY